MLKSMATDGDDVSESTDHRDWTNFKLSGYNIGSLQTT